MERLSRLKINKETLDLNHTLDQRFSTSLSQEATRMGVLQEFLKHGIPDHLAMVTDLFSLRLSKLKMTIANTIAMCCE